MSPSTPDPPSAATRTLRSFGFAARGLAYMVRTQSNARVHLVATLLVVGLGFWFPLSFLEWALILAAIALVWTAEAFNTAIEAVVDLVSPERHPLAKAAKDVAAGAVLIAALFAVTVGALVFIPEWLGRR
jgi:diacylglycerol kinase